MSRLAQLVTPFWRGVLCAVAFIEGPRRLFDWFPGTVRAPSFPARARTATTFLSDSSWVVRLAGHEQAELPLLVTGRVLGATPANYTLHDLGRDMRQSLERRAPTLLQARAGGGILATGLAGAHTRLETTIYGDGNVEMRVVRVCPPAPWRPFGPWRGHELTWDLAGAVVDPPELVRTTFDHAVSAAARAACNNEVGVYPDRTSRVTSSVAEVQVVIGQPRAIHEAFPLYFFESTSPDTVIHPPHYRIVDTTIAKLTTLGIEGLRPGTTTIEGRGWTRDANGVEGAGKAMIAVPLVITR